MRSIFLAPFALLFGVGFLVLLIAIALSSPLGALVIAAFGALCGWYVFCRWMPTQDAKVEKEEEGESPFACASTEVREARPPAPLAGIVAAAPKGLGVPALLGVVKGAKGHKWLDIAKAPHVLVGGSTGSGKSVFLNTLISTACASSHPTALNLIVVDPKRVELGRFASLPHCKAHVTDKPSTLKVLRAVANEMDRRYSILQGNGARDIEGTGLARILLVIDEFADLVIPHSKDKQEKELCESLVAMLARLLALGRAAGIHVVLATQSPRREVVTGLIKGNAPMRIAFRTSNAVESRIVLDTKGAEALPGCGAGLILSPQVPNPVLPGTPVGFQGVMLSESLIDAYCGSK